MHADNIDDVTETDEDAEVPGDLLDYFVQTDFPEKEDEA